MTEFDIPYYLDYLSPQLLQHLTNNSEPVPAIPGLQVAKGLRSQFPDIEKESALGFVCELYSEVQTELNKVLELRKTDRQFIDQQTETFAVRNKDHGYLSPDYETVIGCINDQDRVVVGPQDGKFEIRPVTIPEFLQGSQVTLFGPPVNAKMAINAMNALSRRSDNEPPIVTRLVEASGQIPRWGADNEDSQTPIMTNYLQACQNLIGCFDGSLSTKDPVSNKKYQLEENDLSIPIKRIPGLALPDGNHLLNGNPLPLHLFDFAMHLYHNFDRPKALVFYVPKLENEIEADYVRTLVEAAERKITTIHPKYEPGTIRLLVVFENPRAIFRIREMANALWPYFVGGSLGWHDFLASTARIFRNDPNYRIPVKADPNIVINHIRQSHRLLVDSLEPLGAIRIGGMYGVLHEDNNPASFVISMVGYIKDVVTQLKRGLTGFWVAHPDFVRTGMALVEAYRQQYEDDSNRALDELICELVDDQKELEELLQFVHSDDVPGLDPDEAGYARSVLAANIEVSNVIANDDPEEVRYNIFQALQYLADWLSGNGCVALPAKMKNAHGEEVFVRIMDDLATTERSRWELWAEVYHGRVSVETFDQLLAEEVDFIRYGGDDNADKKRTQVQWHGKAAKWYPIAIKLLRQLVVTEHPVEFATELLLPFAFPTIRESEDPWQLACELCPGKYVSPLD